jgi:hypothetical protein
MKQHPFFLTALLILATLAAPNCVRAEFTFTLTQVGSDVVATGSGTINTAGLNLLDPSFTSNGPIIEPTSALLAAGTGPLLRKYDGISGPTSWGPGGVTVPSASSGDLLVVAGINPFLYVPASYVSGDPLANSVTFANKTILGLGFVPGTYQYTWGFGPNADSLTVTSVVPEPGVWTLVSGILLAVFGVHRVRSKRQKVLV